MRFPPNNPEQFALEFNTKIPGAYREVIVDDIRFMTECSLIHKFGYYSSEDFETVRRILVYEQKRVKAVEKRVEQLHNQQKQCNLCRKALVQLENKRGRQREYCSECEPARIRLRGVKYRWKKAHSNHLQTEAATALTSIVHTD